MSKLSRKPIIIICAVLAVAGLITAVIILAGNNGRLNGTVTGSDNYRQEIENYVIDWDSSEKEHEEGSSNAKCSIFVDDTTVFYDDFNEGWIDATTKYKNEGDLVFTLYSDWVADEDGIFGENGSKGESYINGSGGLLIKNWKNDITIDFNGYKIDRNMTDRIESYGTVIKVDESENVYFKNGCVTGGSNLDDGGGVLIYGKYDVHFDNMTVTGNVVGNNGGGVYVGSHACAYFNDTVIQGNYADNYGGGVYADYKTKKYIESISLKDYVKIRYNIGSDYCNNLTFCVRDGTCSQIFEDEPSKDSYIGVSIDNKEADDIPFIYVSGYEYKKEKVKMYYSDDNRYKFIYTKAAASKKAYALGFGKK